MFWEHSSILPVCSSLSFWKILEGGGKSFRPLSRKYIYLLIPIVSFLFFFFLFMETLLLPPVRHSLFLVRLSQQHWEELALLLVAGLAGQANWSNVRKPELGSKLLVLEVLPGSQAIYGLVGAFLVTVFTISDLTLLKEPRFFKHAFH